MQFATPHLFVQAQLDHVAFAQRRHTSSSTCSFLAAGHEDAGGLRAMLLPTDAERVILLRVCLVSGGEDSLLYGWERLAGTPTGGQ